MLNSHSLKRSDSILPFLDRESMLPPSTNDVDHFFFTVFNAKFGPLYHFFIFSYAFIKIIDVDSLKITKLTSYHILTIFL